MGKAKTEIKTIGVMTSGGDAPGMNAAIRAVVRTSINNGLKVKGIKRGYEGLLSEDIMDMKSSDVSEIIQRGGTILLTARSKEMMTTKGTQKAADNCKKHDIEALVIIGGDGSLTGGLELSRLGINVIGIPGTIDLDLPCTEYTIGFDTAVNTVMSAITNIRDTSSSHERCSLVEVMGRNCGAIAQWCAMVGGADEVLLPEAKKVTFNDVINTILRNREKGKGHNLVIVAEGVGASEEMAKMIQRETGIETRATILGHIQRGGSPTAVDRLHASLMGHKAVEAILNGEKSKIVIYKDGKHSYTDLEEGLQKKPIYNSKIYDIVKTLSI